MKMCIPVYLNLLFNTLRSSNSKVLPKFTFIDTKMY